MADEKEMQKPTGPDTQEKGKPTGGKADSGSTETITLDEARRMADSAVSKANAKWREEAEQLIADKSKDSETKLTEFKSKVDELEQYSNFIESAHSAGIRNFKAAYVVAKAHGFFKHGKFLIDDFKKDNPEFFGPAQTVKADAGTGSGKQEKPRDMNTWIRDQLGRNRR